jgi:hypothetical protein
VLKIRNRGVLLAPVRDGGCLFILSIKDVTGEKEYIHKDITSSYNMYKRKTKREVAETIILASYMKKIT